MSKLSNWAPSKEFWPAGCTPTRDGWVRWYRGKTRTVAPKSCTLTEVESRWIELKDRLDREAAEQSRRDLLGSTYRDALSDFLKSLEARIDAPKRPLSERTYDNYVKLLNDFGSVIVDGKKVADMLVADVGPRQFTAYAARFRTWKPSGFDTVVTRVSAFFRWCISMEYINRYRPGPEFIRPAKQELRDNRLALVKSYGVDQIAKAYVAGNITIRCWIALGLCGGFINTDIAHATRNVMGIDDGVCDFRRRKHGKIRRVIPWPADVLDLLRSYQRPEPLDRKWKDLFFITRHGLPFCRARSRNGSFAPSNTVSRLWAKHMAACGIDGKVYTGLRTTLYNRWPRGSEYELERKMVMGRAQGTIDLDSYLEEVGLDRLRHCVESVWAPVRAEIQKLNNEHPDAAPASAVA